MGGDGGKDAPRGDNGKLPTGHTLTMCLILTQTHLKQKLNQQKKQLVVIPLRAWACVSGSWIAWHCACAWAMPCDYGCRWQYAKGLRLQHMDFLYVTWRGRSNPEAPTRSLVSQNRAREG